MKSSTSPKKDKDRDPIRLPVIVVKNRYYKGMKAKTLSPKAKTAGLSGHMKYIKYRPKEKDEDRRIFNEKDDDVAFKDAVRDIMEHYAVAVNYHTLVLSPDPNEPVSDLREWTRAVMKDLAEKKGLDLHWYAVQHRNTIEHPHVHVVLAGAAEDREGKTHTVRIDKEDLEFLRESGLEHSDHDIYQMMDILDDLDDLLMQEQQELDASHDQTEVSHDQDDSPQR